MINNFNGADNSWNLLNQSMAGFFAQSRSAVIDNRYRQELVSKSRVLLQKQPLSKAIIDVLTRGVIGSGLHLKDENDIIDVLSTLHLFDARKQLDLYQMQQLIWQTTLICGECFLIRQKTSEDQQYSSWLITEPDHVFNPPMLAVNPDGQCMYKGHMVIDGIEFKADGTPWAIHYCKNPYTADISSKSAWQRIFFEDKEGTPNIIHVRLQDRVDYPRGLPILTPLIENLYSLYAYQTAQVQMGILQSCNAFVIKTNGLNTSLNPFIGLSTADLNAPLVCNGMTTGGEHEHEPSKDFTIVPPNQTDIMGMTTTANWVRPGSSIHLNVGEELQNLSTDAPGSSLRDFYDLVVEQCGSALGIPPAVLRNVFDASFSASKCSVSQWQYTVGKFSRLFIEQCLKPLYRVFLIENSKDQKDAIVESVHSVWRKMDANTLLDEARSADFCKTCMEMGIMSKEEASMRLLGHALDEDAKMTSFEF